MTDLEKLKTTFTDIGIGYSENKQEMPYPYIEIFLHYSNMTFIFDLEGKYITYDAVDSKLILELKQLIKQEIINYLSA